jgi:hypothetical protein
MAGVAIVMAIAVFVAGVLIGAIGAVAVGVGCGDSRYPLTGEASGRLATFARRLNGLGRRDLNLPPGGRLSR